MPDWMIIAGLIPKLRGCRIVLYSREDMPRLFAADHDVPFSHPAVRFLRAVQLACYRMADRVITTQELARRDLIEAGIAADKIVAIPNAPDEQVFLAGVSDDAVRPPSNTGLRLVTHGLMMKRYGIETLIQAVGLLKDRIPDVHLEIIGEGEYRPALEALVDRMGLRSAVSFTGYLPDYQSVAPRLLRAHIGVVPIWTDFQLCNKLVDYLALGLPTITTASAALAPYLDDGAVCFVERRDPRALADAIEALYLNPERCADLGAAGRVAYRKYLAWASVRPAYLGVYGSLDHVDRSDTSAPEREVVRAAG
jgi:glycosyltransferase involved in cell wall biosynthesis